MNCPRPYKPQIKVCKQNIMSSQRKENLKKDTSRTTNIRW